MQHKMHWRNNKRKIHFDFFMISDDLLSWYETNLPARERKRRGHFSTPPRLVEQILDACGYTAAHDLTSIRVLDPACGSGNFLVGVTHRLIDFGKRTQMTHPEIARLIQRNVWGLDPDPIACFLAEMQLHTLFAGEIKAQSTPNNYNVQANILDTPATALTQLNTHIHQADGLVMPWEQCNNIDLFLANPPYLASKNADLSGYRSAQSRGQSDSYLLFINIALQVVRPGGWIALVLPDPVLARANAAKERQQLLAETTIHHLWHLANVFTAYVGAVVIIAQKGPVEKNHQIAWKREHWHHSIARRKKRSSSTSKSNKQEMLEAGYIPLQTIAQTLLQAQPDAELRYLLSNTQGTLVGRLNAHLNKIQKDKIQSHSLVPLSSYVLIRRGEELAKDSALLVEFPTGTDETWYPVLRGGSDICAYRQPQAQRWIARTGIAKRMERYLAPKLLVVKSAGHLQTTLDLKGHVVLQTLYLLQIQTNRPLQDQSSDIERQNEDDLYFLLALLNSQLLKKYIYVLHTAYKWVQPQIEQRVLAQLPIPLSADTRKKEQIVSRARLMMQTAYELTPTVETSVQAQAQQQEMYREQELAICDLYEAALDATIVQV